RTSHGDPNSIQLFTLHPLIRYHPIIKQAISFSKVPKRNPINDPRAARRAWPDWLLAIISPANAPIKGPTMIPQGGKNIPAIRPMVHPQIPYLLPPNFLVPYRGIK